ncbi:MAG: TenA family protein, partial [Bryobacterales bacterium]|nr:TenA family protein [Bryobacteraceae bacterium]MDW8131462.1 TenA family protein [Bryobacterales bacterium]
MLHESLWDSCRDLADACLRHPFVQGIAAGTLDPRLYDDYVRQDAFYLRAFVRAYALALARCDDLEAARTLHELAGGALDELQMHLRHAAQVGLDLNDVQPNPACLAYTDFLLATAWGGTLAEILAAMTPCMRLYAWLGEQLAPAAAPSHP